MLTAENVFPTLARFVWVALLVLIVVRKVLVGECHDLRKDKINKNYFYGVQNVSRFESLK